MSESDVMTELRDAVSFFQKNGKLFQTTVLVCLLIGSVAWALQQKHVDANVTLNVTRSGVDTSAEYQYHDFYRLQADERFADTVVRWLGAPRITEDIAKEAKIASVSFRAGRLSSQMIEVRYSAHDAQEARMVAQTMIERLNQEIQLLDANQQEKTWFLIVGHDPVVSDGRIALIVVLGIALTVGVFGGFWAVLIRYYFSDTVHRDEMY